MTKKDCELIAAAISAVAKQAAIMGEGTRPLVWLVNELAESLAQDNPRFNVVRFAKACGCA